MGWRSKIQLVAFETLVPFVLRFWLDSGPKFQRTVEDDKPLPTPSDYVLDPHEAVSEIKAGEACFKKGNLEGAALRFREATKWNPQSAMAYLRLSEALEKTNDTKGALEARTKYIELTRRGVK